MGVISWKLDIPTDLSICNNQGCVFLRVQLMIHLPWNFDTASENNISIISLPYSNQLRGILIDQREIWRHTYIKYPHLSPNYAFGITFEWLVCWSKVHVLWKGHKIRKKLSKWQKKILSVLHITKESDSLGWIVFNSNKNRL